MFRSVITVDLFSRILHLPVNFNKYCMGNITFSFIDLPSKIREKAVYINVYNFDNYCIDLSALAGLYPVEWRPQRNCFEFNRFGVSNELQSNKTMKGYSFIVDSLNILGALCCDPLVKSITYDSFRP